MTNGESSCPRSVPVDIVQATCSCPAALGSKDEQPSSYDRHTGLFLVPTNHCMNYEPFQIEYTAGQPYVGATLTMFTTPNSHGGMDSKLVLLERCVKQRRRGRSERLCLHSEVERS
jgi:glucose dehydrogenase